MVSRFFCCANNILHTPAARLLIIIIFCFSGCVKKPPPAQVEFALGTFCSINLFEYGTNDIYLRIFSRIRDIDRSMSVMTIAAQTSDVVKINENAGIEPVKIGHDLIEVLEQAKYYAEISKGAFDPTIEPLVRLWGIGTDSQRIPESTEIEEALALTNWQELIIDSAAGTAFLRRTGMALDLGAIAKGYAADEAARIAREGGVKKAIINLGGNVLVIGAKSIGKKPADFVLWRIGLQDPLNERGNYIGELLVQDKSIVTSGIYERYFETEGKRYHHILSTIDGRPIQNSLLAVTIVTERSIDADGLSTSVFALGFEKGRALIESLADTEAIFIFDDRSVSITTGLKGIFSIRSNTYSQRQGSAD